MQDRIITRYTCKAEHGRRRSSILAEFGWLISLRQRLAHRLGGGAVSNANIIRLSGADLPQMLGLNALFARAFDEADTYLGDPSSDAYLAELAARDQVLYSGLGLREEMLHFDLAPEIGKPPAI